MTNNAPHVIRVNPQMSEHTGGAARAMRNCGLENHRLVNPRDGWPDEQAEAMAAGALGVRKDLPATPGQGGAQLTLCFEQVTGSKSGRFGHSSHRIG